MSTNKKRFGDLKTGDTAYWMACDHNAARVIQSGEHTIFAWTYHGRPHAFVASLNWGPNDEIELTNAPSAWDDIR